MASEKLVSYLTELGTNADKLKKFQSDPKAHLKESGLSDQEQQAVLSGDPAKIRAAAGGDFGQADVVVVVLVLA